MIKLCYILYEGTSYVGMDGTMNLAGRLVCFAKNLRREGHLSPIVTTIRANGMKGENEPNV